MTTYAILGDGNVGQSLASRLHGPGDSTRFGVREPGKPADDAVPRLGIADAVRGADLVLLAVPAGAAVDVIRASGAAHGTVVVDCTNPLRWSDGPVWTPPPEGSVTQQLAVAFPALRFVKGFNHFGAEIQRDPSMRHGPADAFFAADDAAAKAEVMAVASRMGFHAIDAGPLRNAAVLENLAMLWIHLSSVGKRGREFALKLEAR